MDTKKLLPLLPDLVIFVAVIEQGNFTDAAKKLGRTPAAVSKQISRLEAALALKLLQRSTQKLTLTESGKMTFDYCKKLLNDIDQTVNKNAALSPLPTGLLRISAAKPLVNQLLKPLFMAFSKQYPTVKLHVKVTEQLSDPLYDAVDIVIHRNKKPIESLVNINIGKIEHVLCASPDYIKQHGTPTHPMQLQNYQCIGLDEYSTDPQWQFTRDGQEITVQVDERHVINHSTKRKNAIEQGLGIGILPNFIAKKAIEKGTLVAVLEDWQWQESDQEDIYVQFLPSKHVPSKNTAFIDFIKQKMSQ